MRVDGSCHCGALTFAAEIEPSQVSICHCTDCQTLTGTAFRVSVPCNAEDFTLTSGQPSVYVKTAESGALRAQGFCGQCGAPIYSTSADREPEVYAVRVGALKQREILPPTHEIWRNSALPWVPQMPDIKSWPGEDA
ncbi:GFA family protein [Corticibacterium sp. UT-5YL-CI-8]|nr:GFA family protein [Tianweitania sp. UT-5YL-CI-8]